MQIKSKSGRVFDLSSDEEDAKIRAGIAEDADTFEATEADVKQMKRVGRPPSAITKERITVRLSPEVTTYFRSLGSGWQTRMDEVLRDYVASRQ